MRRALLAAACAALVTTASIQAATFAVPKDRDFVRRAEAIVVATALDSYTRLDADGAIDTVTNLTVEEVIKGPVKGRTLEIHEPGGIYKDRITMIPGVPRFDDGARMLLFLVHTEGGWRVSELVLGKFTFTPGRSGRKLLMRDDDAIEGWESDGKPYQGQSRSATEFLKFVRAEATGAMGVEDYRVDDQPLAQADDAGSGGATATSYTVNYDGLGKGVRWNSFAQGGVNFYTINASANGITAVNTAFASWNGDAQSNVNLVNAGVDASDARVNNGIEVPDNQNSITFESSLQNYGAGPISCTANSWGGTVGIGFVSNAFGEHTGPNGEIFVTATEGDVEMNVGVKDCAFMASVGDLKTAVTHEVGHAIGFRHADENRNFGGAVGPCSGAVGECSSSAVMKAVFPTGLNGTLQTWDINAVRAVYPTPIVTPPASGPASITATPTGSNSVYVVWTAVANANAYEVQRSADNVNFAPVGTTTGNASTALTDTTAASNTSYVYRVRGTNEGGSGPFSSTDFATTVVFTDDPLTGGTAIKAAHINELRTAVNAMRTLAGMGAATFTDPVLSSSVTVKATHITELRTHLNAARGSLGFGALTFTDNGLPTGTLVKAVHITELRNGVK